MEGEGNRPLRCSDWRGCEGLRAFSWLRGSVSSTHHNSQLQVNVELLDGRTVPFTAVFTPVPYRRCSKSLGLRYGSWPFTCYIRAVGVSDLAPPNSHRVDFVFTIE